MTRDEWLAVAAGRPVPESSGLTRTDRIASIDVTGDVLASE